MNMLKSDDLGKLVLRLAVGILVLLHGLLKVVNGVGGPESMLVAKGLPGWLAYGAYLGEVLGPILIVMGTYTRVGALLVIVNMLFAFFLAHGGELTHLTRSGGWAPELSGMFLFGALAIFFLGAGRFSLSGAGGRYN